MGGLVPLGTILIERASGNGGIGVASLDFWHLPSIFFHYFIFLRFRQFPKRISDKLVSLENWLRSIDVQCGYLARKISQLFGMKRSITRVVSATSG